MECILVVVIYNKIMGHPSMTRLDDPFDNWQNSLLLTGLLPQDQWTLQTIDWERYMYFANEFVMRICFINNIYIFFLNIYSNTVEKSKIEWCHGWPNKIAVILLMHHKPKPLVLPNKKSNHLILTQWHSLMCIVP
jgi:Ni,Fe-hydrogenase I cytochrome b subunit